MSVPENFRESGENDWTVFGFHVILRHQRRQCVQCMYYEGGPGSGLYNNMRRHQAAIHTVLYVHQPAGTTSASMHAPNK